MCWLAKVCCSFFCVLASELFLGVAGDKKYRNPLAGYPFLIGTSRKSFIGGVLAQGPGGRETLPTERVWATAAGVACAVQQGALAVRVHDTREMADVVRMADALWG